MNTIPFDTSYTQLAYQMLKTSEKPYEVAHTKKKLLSELTAYKDKLEEFEPYFDLYPALKKEIVGNLWEYKVGAFFQDRLVTFFNRLEEVEELKSELQKLIVLLYKEYDAETKTWLPEREEMIKSYIVHLSISTIQEIIDFLQGNITFLKDEYARLKRLEKQRSEVLINANKPDVLPRGGKGGRNPINEQERKEKQEQAKKEFLESMGIRRK
ncbi:MAG: hypothetical protein LBI45_02890 [Bacteroidales bacterium]|nr:hypothetical protein [Bacteroidales bacterium]